MEEIRRQAALAVADALVEDVRRQRAHNATLGSVVVRFPPPVVRAVVLVQAILKRRAFLRSFSGAEEDVAEFAPPPPLLAVSLYFCRRMRSVKWIDAEGEAMAVAGIVSAKQWGLTLGGVREVLRFYEGVVPDEHMSLIVLREKFEGMVVEVTERLQDSVRCLETPAEVQAAIDTCRRETEILPDLEERIFSGAWMRLREVLERAEREVRRDLGGCTSIPEFNKVADRLDPLFGPVQTPVRAELELARTRRVQFLEMELETRWSRPFAGPLPPHSRAARRYQLELGKDHPKVVDFVAEEQRHASSLEATFEVQLSNLQGQMQTLWQRRKDAKVRLMQEGIDMQMSEVSEEIQREIEGAILEIGPDNSRVKERARELLASDAHAAVFSINAENTADELRTEISEADESPEGVDRRRGIASTLLALLDELTPEHPTQALLRGEFDPELAEAAERREIMRSKEPSQVADADLPPSVEIAPIMDMPFEEQAVPPLRPMTAGEPEGEQDPWASPPGFADLEFAEEPKFVGRLPNGGLPDLSPEAMTAKAAEAAAAPEATVDEQTKVMLHSLQFHGAASTADAPSTVTAQLLLTDLNADVVQLHSEAVFSNKFARAMAESTGVPRHRIQVTSFDSNPVRVLFSIGAPEPSELEQMSQEVNTNSVDDLPPGEGRLGPLSALEVFEELERQIADGGSMFQLGEVGPFVAGATIERTGVSGVASIGGVGAKIEHLSLQDAYSAPPLSSAALFSTSKREATAPSGTQTTFARTRQPDSTLLAATRNPLSSTTWGASRIAETTAKSSTKSRFFRTTCPDATEDSTKELWAQPYQDQPEYSFYDRVVEEQAKAPVMLPDSKKKFSTHATFHITRHPAAGAPSLGGYTAKPTVIAAADSWIDAEARREQAGKQLLAQELGARGGVAVADAIDVADMSPPGGSSQETAATKATSDGAAQPVGMAMEDQAMMGSAAPKDADADEVDESGLPSEKSRSSRKSASSVQAAAVVQDEPEPEESLDREADNASMPSKRDSVAGRRKSNAEAETAGDVDSAAKERRRSSAKPAAAYVQMSCVVRNVELSALKADADLLSRFELVVKQTFAEESGHGAQPENVQLVLSAGSVRIQASIQPPRGIEAAAIAQKLKSSATFAPTLQARVDELFQKVEGIKESSDRAITVDGLTEPVVVGGATAALAEGGSLIGDAIEGDELEASVAEDPEAEGGKKRRSKKSKKEKESKKSLKVVVEEGDAAADASPSPSPSGSPSVRKESSTRSRKKKSKGEQDDEEGADEDEPEKKEKSRALRKKVKREEDEAAADDEESEKKAGARTRRRPERKEAASEASDNEPALAARRGGRQRQSHLSPSGRQDDSSRSPSPSADRGGNLKKQQVLGNQRSASAHQLRKSSVSGKSRDHVHNFNDQSMDLSTLMGLPKASAFAGMYGGLPGTGIRVLAEKNDRLPELVGRPSADNFKSPAYVRKAYRQGTVGVGPPYHLNEPEQEYSPQWTSYRLLDAALEKEDWKRCYSSVSSKVGPNKRVSKLGPDRSIRGVGSHGMSRSVSLPRLRTDGRNMIHKTAEVYERPAKEKEQLSQSMKEKRNRLRQDPGAADRPLSWRSPEYRADLLEEEEEDFDSEEEEEEHSFTPPKVQEAWKAPEPQDASKEEATPSAIEEPPPVPEAPAEPPAAAQTERKKKKARHVPIKSAATATEDPASEEDGKARTKAKAKAKGDAKQKDKKKKGKDKSQASDDVARSSGPSDVEKDVAKAGKGDKKGKKGKKGDKKAKASTDPADDFEPQPLFEDGEAAAADADAKAELSAGVASYLQGVLYPRTTEKAERRPSALADFAVPAGTAVPDVIDSADPALATPGSARSASAPGKSATEPAGDSGEGVEQAAEPDVSAPRDTEPTSKPEEPDAGPETTLPADAEEATEPEALADDQPVKPEEAAVTDARQEAEEEAPEAAAVEQPAKPEAATVTDADQKVEKVESEAVAPADGDRPVEPEQAAPADVELTVEAEVEAPAEDAEVESARPGDGGQLAESEHDAPTDVEVKSQAVTPASRERSKEDVELEEPEIAFADIADKSVELATSFAYADDFEPEPNEKKTEAEDVVVPEQPLASEAATGGAEREAQPPAAPHPKVEQEVEAEIAVVEQPKQPAAAAGAYAEEEFEPEDAEPTGQQEVVVPEQPVEPETSADAEQEVPAEAASPASDVQEEPQRAVDDKPVATEDAAPAADVASLADEAHEEPECALDDKPAAPEDTAPVADGASLADEAPEELERAGDEKPAAPEDAALVGDAEQAAEPESATPSGIEGPLELPVEASARPDTVVSAEPDCASTPPHMESAPPSMISMDGSDGRSAVEYEAINKMLGSSVSHAERHYLDNKVDKEEVETAREDAETVLDSRRSSTLGFHALQIHLHQSDSQVEPEDEFELLFDVPFGQVDHKAFVEELHKGFIRLGAPEYHVSRVATQLREGSTIARTFGPMSSIQVLKALPHGKLTVMGHSAHQVSEPTASDAQLPPAGPSEASLTAPSEEDKPGPGSKRSSEVPQVDEQSPAERKASIAAQPEQEPLSIAGADSSRGQPSEQPPAAGKPSSEASSLAQPGDEQAPADEQPPPARKASSVAEPGGERPPVPSKRSSEVAPDAERRKSSSAVPPGDELPPPTSQRSSDVQPEAEQLPSASKASSDVPSEDAQPPARRKSSSAAQPGDEQPPAAGIPSSDIAPDAEPRAASSDVPQGDAQPPAGRKSSSAVPPGDEPVQPTSKPGSEVQPEGEQLPSTSKASSDAPPEDAQPPARRKSSSAVQPGDEQPVPRSQSSPEGLPEAEPSSEAQPDAEQAPSATRASDVPSEDAQLPAKRKSSSAVPPMSEPSPELLPEQEQPPSANNSSAEVSPEDAQPSPGDDQPPAASEPSSDVPQKVDELPSASKPSSEIPTEPAQPSAGRKSSSVVQPGDGQPSSEVPLEAEELPSKDSSDVPLDALLRGTRRHSSFAVSEASSVVQIGDEQLPPAIGLDVLPESEPSPEQSRPATTDVPPKDQATLDSRPSGDALPGDVQPPAPSESPAVAQPRGEQPAVPIEPSEAFQGSEQPLAPSEASRPAADEQAEEPAAASSKAHSLDQPGDEQPPVASGPSSAVLPGGERPSSASKPSSVVRLESEKPAREPSPDLPPGGGQPPAANKSVGVPDVEQLPSREEPPLLHDKQPPAAGSTSPPAPPAERPGAADLPAFTHVPQFSSTLRPPRPASREGAITRCLKTNSGATKQEVASFAQSLTSSIFKNTHKNVASRARSAGVGLAAARAAGMQAGAAASSSSYSPPPVGGVPSARRTAAEMRLATGIQTGFGAASSSYSPPPVGESTPNGGPRAMVVSRPAAGHAHPHVPPLLLGGSAAVHQKAALSGRGTPGRGLSGRAAIPADGAEAGFAGPLSGRTPSGRLLSVRAALPADGS